MLDHGDLPMTLNEPEAMEEKPRPNGQIGLNMTMTMKAMEAFVRKRLDGFQVVEEGALFAFAFPFG
jgi:hypothetical protein